MTTSRVELKTSKSTARIMSNTQGGGFFRN